MQAILGRLFLILFTSINLLWADVLVSVHPQAIYEGESANFVISVDGKNIEFPKISKISGFRVIGTSSSQSMSMVNMDITRTTSKTYSFRPTKSITIPSFSVNADGKSYQTEELKLTVLKPVASKNGAPFVLEMKIDHNTVYVGEAIDLNIRFKQKRNARAEEIQLGEPKLENFWIKKRKKVDHNREGNYIVQTLHYQLFPQKSGDYTIKAIQALIGRANQRGGGFNTPFFNDPFFGQQLNWQKIYSNDVKITVNALPNGLELYGDFSIKAEVDKQHIQANRPVNLSITVEGEGNIDDVKKFELDFKHAIVYADEPKITAKKFTQKIAIIADQNFSVPVLELSYFDKKTKSIKTIKTKKIEVEVNGGNQSITKPSTIEVSPKNTLQSIPQQIQTETKVIIEEEDSFTKYLFAFLGFLLGVNLTYGYFKFGNRKKKIENDMIRAIKKSKNDKALFELLLPYSKDHPFISKALNLLEENLYKGSTHKIDKEELMEAFEEMQ